MKKIILIAASFATLLLGSAALEARHCCHPRVGFNINIQPAPRTIVAYQPAPVVYAAPTTIVYPETTVIYQLPVPVYYPVRTVHYHRQPRASFSFRWSN